VSNRRGRHETGSPSRPATSCTRPCQPHRVGSVPIHHIDFVVVVVPSAGKGNLRPVWGPHRFQIEYSGTLGQIPLARPVGSDGEDVRGIVRKIGAAEGQQTTNTTLSDPHPPRRSAKKEPSNNATRRHMEATIASHRRAFPRTGARGSVTISLLMGRVLPCSWCFPCDSADASLCSPP
jgi:hypothetical protein